MTAACASKRPHDRVGDWLEELALVCEAAGSLPESARAAVINALDAFEQEDGVLAPDAIRTRALLTSSAKPRRAEATGPGCRARFARLVVEAVA